MNKKLNEFNEYLVGRKVAIIGLGVSNMPLLKYMNKKGAEVTVFDDREITEIPKEAMEEVMRYDLPHFFGKEALSNLKGFAIIFRSPSCMPWRKELVEAKEKGAIITSEIEMLMKMCPGTVIGVTGSDGKTTTTSLIYEILKKAGYNCYLGGNIGAPLFTKLGEMRRGRLYRIGIKQFSVNEYDCKS